MGKAKDFQKNQAKVPVVEIDRKKVLEQSLGKAPKKVFILDGAFANSVVTMFKDRGWEIATHLGNADLIQFTGGSDINPAIYGHMVHPKTGYSAARDEREIKMFQLAKAAKMPMAGICRGAQLLNALAGGTMWQDVDGHGSGQHKVTDLETGDEWMTTSIHHQMMEPTKDVKWIGASHNIATDREKRLANGKIVVVKNTFAEPEVLYYEGINALLIQGHPEIAPKAMKDRYFSYLERYLCV